MISYGAFEYSINAIKAYFEYEDKLANLGVNIWEREEMSNLITSLIRCLSEGLGLSYSDVWGSVLDYWIYELEFGKDPSGLMEDNPDKEAFTTTLKAFYDFLTNKNN